MARRTALLGVSVLVAGSIAALAPPADATLPATATLVTVAAGANHSAIDGHLHPAASISGTVTAAAGGTISTVVSAYRDGSVVATANVAANGSYLIGGLTAGSYAVCVAGSSTFGGNSTTGYQGRCFMTKAFFDGSKPPVGAHLIALTDAQQFSPANITLPSGAGIIGKVVNGASQGIGNVAVVAVNRSTGVSFPGFTAGSGRYSVIGLSPSLKGYSVCANPRSSTAGATGYRPECFRDVAWSGGKIPAGATAVPVSTGVTTTGANIELRKGAAITGKVTDASNGHALPFVGVAAFSAAGAQLTSTATNALGNYTLRGLGASSTDRVCVFPAHGSTLGVSYKGQCWKNVAWKGGALPSGTTGIATKIGQAHGGINFKLTKVTVVLGSISGTITDGANPLQSAQVTLFSSTGTPVENLDTNSAGHFAFPNLSPSAAGYLVCAQATEQTFVPATHVVPPGGWAPRCFDSVAWDGQDAPDAATKLPISQGQQKNDVNIGLTVGGTISGTTLQFGVDAPVLNVQVDVFTATGTLLAQSYSGPVDGTYAINNLSPSADGYVVCFDGRAAETGQANTVPQCWQDQPWDGTA